MQLSSTLTWLVDAASALPGPEQFLAELGMRLIADDMPLAGGALTLAVPHPIIARRTWLWRAGNGEVIEAVGFAPADFGGAASSSGDAGRSWLAGLADGAVHEDSVGAAEAGPAARMDRAASSSRKRKPIGCARSPALPQRRSLRFRRARRCPPCWKPISAGAAPRACWRGRCGAKSARPSGRCCSMLICAASPRCRRPSLPRLSSPPLAAGSTASAALSTPLAARC